MKKLLPPLLTGFLFCSGAEQRMPLSILKKSVTLKKKRHVRFPSYDHPFCKNLAREKITPVNKYAEHLKKMQFLQNKERERQTQEARILSPVEEANIAWSIQRPTPSFGTFNMRAINASDIILKRCDEGKLTALSDVEEFIYEPSSPLTIEEQEIKVRSQMNANRTVSFIKITEMCPDLLKKNIEGIVTNLFIHKKKEMELFIDFVISVFVENAFLDPAINKADFEAKLQVASEQGVFLPDNFKGLIQEYLDTYDYDLPEQNLQMEPLALQF